MIRKSSLAFLLGIFVAGPATQAQPAAGPIEEGVESSTESVQLPASLPSSWLVKPCPECSNLTLRMDEATQFFVSSDPVNLATLSRYASRETNLMSYFYEPGSLRVTRVILHAELDAADRAPPPQAR